MDELLLVPDERLEALEAVEAMRRQRPGPARQMSLLEWAAELELAASELRKAAGLGCARQARDAAARAAAQAVEIIEALSR